MLKKHILHKDIKAKLKNNQALDRNDINCIVRHHLALYGFSQGYIPHDRQSSVLFINRVRGFYDAQHPDNERLKQTAKTYALELKFNPPRSWDKLEVADVFSITEQEQHDLKVAYVSRFGNIEQLNQNKSTDCMLMLERLTKLHNEVSGMKQFAEDLKSRT